MAARAEYESAGVALSQLHACDPEGPGGTALIRCANVYVPAPTGQHGMVFQISRSVSSLAYGSSTSATGRSISSYAGAWSR